MAPPNITPLALYFNTSLGTAPTNGGGATYASVQVPLTGDTKVLAYALGAELLEATLYQQAYLYLTGVALPSQPSVTTVTDALGYTYGAGALNLGVAATDPIALYLAEFGAIEQMHATFLIDALGYSTSSPQTGPYPASVAFAFGLHTLTTKEAVAEAVYGAEETGVSAYTGAVPFFTQQSPYLQIAASILGTEARHTAAIAAQINADNSNGAIETAPMYNDPSKGRDVPLTPDQILNTGSGSTDVPGVPADLYGAGSAAGMLLPISGPNGAAVGPANGTTTPTYNGFVYSVTT